MITCVISHDSHYTKTFLEYWKLEDQDARLIFNVAVEFGAIDAHHQWVADTYRQPVWSCQHSPQLLATPKETLTSEFATKELPPLCA